MPTDLAASVKTVMLALADVFGTEKRAGGDLAARRLRDLATPGSSVDLGQADDGACELARHCLNLPGRTDLGGALADVAMSMGWYRSGQHIGAIPDQLSGLLFTGDLVGHRAPIVCQDVRVGLFMHAPHTHYSERTHPPEETYFMLAGTAEWRCDGRDYVALTPGQFSHHPSMSAHANRTMETPIMAAWRLSGEDLDMRAYLCPDTPTCQTIHTEA